MGRFSVVGTARTGISGVSIVSPPVSVIIVNSGRAMKPSLIEFAI